MTETDSSTPPARSAFKAEIQQLLDILIHSLYSEREIFLRELISNASDALNRFKLERLRSQEVRDPASELGIWLTGDPGTRTLRIRDTGIGLNAEEMQLYLGTIAHSGAKRFIETLRELNGGDTESTREVIGQFGVGFYSVFMVAEEVTVTSRSFEPAAEAAYWRSSGQGSYEVGSAEKAERGTLIEIKLKEDAAAYAEPYRLRQIVKAHSDFVAFPIYLEEGEGWVQVNEQTALWRESPRLVEAEKYTTFYHQLTFDTQEPLHTLHFSADMPIQFYALLFIPSRRDYKVFRQAEDYGLRLYARKVLIDNAFRELLPPYLRFVEGVVDSEDLPLNVSRELVQATPTIARLRKAITGRVMSELERLAENEPETYATFYREFGSFLKEGVAGDPGNTEKLVDLLRFASSRTEELTSLGDYLSRMKPEQKDIYYALGDDTKVLGQSAHLEYFIKNELEVLYLTDPVDPFVIMGLPRYGDKALKNIDDADLELPETKETLELPKDEGFIALTAFVKNVLGSRVESVRESKILSESAARLVNPVGGSSSLYRAQRLIGREAELPPRILELNPKSELVKGLSERLGADDSDPLLPLLIEQLYENELLAEGVHPNPAEMLPRLQRLMAAAVKREG